MINFVFGRAGFGKSQYVLDKIKHDIAKSDIAYLIVPEQQTVLWEARTARELPPSAQLNFEVFNFTRLANRVFRKFGGLSYNYINSGARALMMQSAIAAAAQHLSDQKLIEDTSSVPLLLSAAAELKAYNISPQMLEKACENLKNDGYFGSLTDKLNDLSLVYSIYQTLVKEKFDDAADDLTALAETLRTHDFFNGSNVYIDSFYGYTPQQFEVIKYIFKQADNVTITFCSPEFTTEPKYRPQFETAHITVGILKKIASDCGIIPEITVLDKPTRFKNPAISALEKSIWNFSAVPHYEYNEGISLVRCSDSYDEAEAVAVDIVQKIHMGYRYSDIAIIARHADSKKGIIDTALDKLGIPYYMSSKSSIMSKPIIKLLMNALYIKINSWCREDVLSYIRSGLTGITDDEADIFEKYTSQWNIRGKRFYDDELWNMNPYGYVAEIDDYARKILLSVNNTREKIRIPLIKFHNSISNVKISDACRTVFEFLTELNVPEIINNQIISEREAGHDEKALENAQLWNIITNSLDLLVKIFGEAETTPEHLLQSFTYIFNEIDLGSIPTGTDEVTIGDASLLRLDSVKCVYLIGVNDGEFPQTINDTSYFNDSDKIRLEGEGIVLSSNSTLKSNEELFWFYRSCVSGSNFLWISYSESELTGKIKKPSIAFEHIQKLFPNIKIKSSANLKAIDKLYSKEMGIEYFSELRDTCAGDVLQKIYIDDEIYSSLTSAQKFPITLLNCKINPEISNEIFGKRINLTQTRLENFVRCKFGYYCKYQLKLQENLDYSFALSNIGSFIHNILERFLSSIKNENGISTDMSDEEIIMLADDIIEDYVGKVCGVSVQKSNRMKHLFLRLRRSVILFIKNIMEEFAQCEFIPEFFELHINSAEPDAVPPLKIKLDDNSTISVYGIVDRVDTFRKNGKVYIRVVDYKTGTKKFSLNDVAIGLNLQMLLYLFSIWKMPNGEFKNKLLKNTENEIVPAGILYFSAKPPELTLDPGTTEEEKNESISKKLKRNGLLIDDIEILSAMEPDLKGKYIPASITSKGNYDRYTTVSSLEYFGQLYNQVSDTLKKIGKEMKKGDADAEPLITNTENPCNFCTMKSICRIEFN